MVIRSKGKYPVYDREKGGNPFDWIIQTSARIRAEHINGQGRVVDIPKIDPLTGRMPIKPL